MGDIIRSMCRRAGARTCMSTPVSILAVAFMPLARRGESFGIVRRLIELWRKQRRDDDESGAH
jgi:hypothetical protein